MLGRQGLGAVRSTWRTSWTIPARQLQRTVSTKILSRRSTIRDAREQGSGSRVAIGGWVKSVRKHKSVSFVNVNDGSCLGELQITLPAEEAEGSTNGIIGAKLSDITVGSSIFAEGELREVPGGKQRRLELHPSTLEVLGKCDTQAYPLQKKYHSLEFLRENLHLRARTNTFGAVTRVRNALGQGLHSYFQENDFLHLHSPILTSNDCEGAGEMFRIAKIDGKDEEFFGTPTYLTVSGQLHAEMYASALSKVYTFGPTFRAENSNTTRHLAEFWMVEPEMAFAGLEECVASAQGAIQRSVAHALNTCAEDIAFFNKNYDKKIAERLERVVEKDFARLTYTEAIEVLQKAVAEGRGKVNFEKKPEWGMDLQTEHERFLAEKYVGGPVFVTDYPADIKAFYMRKNAPDEQNRETVAGMDLLVPKIGELVGGSVREERFEVLEKKMRHLGLIPEEDLDEESIASAGGDLDWYLDLRRFGSVPHAGWGLGFERLVLFATGMDNIRDVIPLPRFPGQCKH
ncbi:asparagine-tRNA ligase [Phytophthora nicotianae]|uniref:asparagine--tRNA ligase n=1 Tax=Phytophthora nicotianae TaxID=4792 RepID=W2NP72_PHYNI|nr:asparagine-tRNA ligase [Phytophthora nicotianae]